MSQSRWARKVYNNKILEEFKYKIDIFSKLKSIAIEDKNRIRSRVVKATEQVIAFDAWETVIDEIFNKISFISFLALLLSVFISLNFWSTWDKNYFDMLLLIGIISICTLAILLVTVIIMELYELLNYINYLKLMLILLILYSLTSHITIAWLIGK